MVIEDLLRRVWIVEGDLRKEDRKKAREVEGLLAELGRVGRPKLLVDAAAGHAYVGLIAAELLGIEKVVVIERDPARAAKCRDAASRLATPPALEVRTGEASDRALWPDAPDVVVALHACGDAADQILDAAAGKNARWILVAPCCYGRLEGPAAASAAQAVGMVPHAEIRRRFEQSLTDAARVRRLEAAGYEVTVVPFVPPTVTPHNLLFRARRAGKGLRPPGK